MICAAETREKVILTCQEVDTVNYSQTPSLRNALGPEKLSLLQSVLIKRVNFKENVWSGTKKTVRNNECPY